ncbi:hypothetical protein AVEN_264757-1 [Araneus ventricosus]|uniref:Uncharacterized protein n=1 Tax=Araneus ventricosus TaxID=182803 RepID=A0A4Y2EFP8_ARAVE|nr:hypothetical protein AVEN_264757-1 [Araneus ventricosus]
MDFVILNRIQMTGTAPELAPPLNFFTTPAGRRLPPTYDLTCNRPNTRLIFGGIGFRAWSPLVPGPGPCRCATAALLLCMQIGLLVHVMQVRRSSHRLPSALLHDLSCQKKSRWKKT